MSHSRSTIPLAHSSLSAGAGAEISEGFDLIDINEMVTGGQEHFRMFRINGDSMVPSIPSGAWVVVDPLAEPRNGQPVVAMLNGQYCVKRFEIGRRGLALVSPNASYLRYPVSPSDEFEIVGVVAWHLYPHKNCA